MRADPYAVWLSRGCAALLLALTTSCAQYGQCNGMDYFIYTANSSSPRVFHQDKGRALFFADAPDAGVVLYHYDGSRVVALAALPEAPVAQTSFQGESVVLTRGGLWRLTASDHFEALKRFDAPLPDAPCEPKTDVLIEFDGRLFFVGPDAEGHSQLWVYQPTTDTFDILTVPRSSDFGTGYGGCSDIAQATVVGDRMVFGAMTAGYRPAGMPSSSWWSYDGHNLAVLLPGPYEIYDGNHVTWQGLLWLSAYTFTPPMQDGGVPYGATLGHAVAAYDGGVEPPALVSSLDLTPVGGLGDTLVLLHENPRQLWTYDTQGFSVAVSDLEWCGTPQRFTVVGDQLYFTCYLDQFYVSRGLVAFDVAHRSVEVLLRQGIGTGSFVSSRLLPWGGVLLYAGQDVRQTITGTAQTFTGTGVEPWAYDVARREARRIEDLSPGYTLWCNDL